MSPQPPDPPLIRGGRRPDASPGREPVRRTEVLRLMRRLTYGTTAVLAILGVAFAWSATRPTPTNPDLEPIRYAVDQAAVFGGPVLGVIFLVHIRSWKAEGAGQSVVPFCWLLGVLALLLPVVYVALGPTGESGFSGCGNAFTGTAALINDTVPSINRGACIEQLRRVWWFTGSATAVIGIVSSLAFIAPVGRQRRG